MADKSVGRTGAEIQQRSAKKSRQNAAHALLEDMHEEIGQRVTSSLEREEEEVYNGLLRRSMGIAGWYTNLLLHSKRYLDECSAGSKVGAWACFGKMALQA